MLDTGVISASAGRGLLLLRALILALLLTVLLQGPAEAASAKVVYQGPRTSGGVALTFDDGYGEAACEQISRTLRRMGARATFFINGIHLRGEPARWRRILEGFPVGNHTRSHLWLTRIPNRKIRDQLRNNQWIHRNVLGRPMIKLLRPPYGAYDGRVRKVAARWGYDRIVLWTRTAADTSPKATVASIIRHTTGAPRGSIILMHCARDVTARALPAIIRHYQRRGIRLIGLDEMFHLGDYRRR